MGAISKIKFRLDIKILVLVCLISLFLFVAYWNLASYNHFLGFISGSNPSSINYVTNLGFVYWIGHIGLTARFIGVFLGILCLIFFSAKKIAASKLKTLLGFAVLMECIYFISYIPNTPYLWSGRFGEAFYLGLGYFIQFLLVSPIFTVFAYTIFRTKQILDNQRFWKFCGFSFLGYICALGINSLFRWFDMGTINLDFLNSALLMSLAVGFSVLAARSLIKMELKAARWIGLSLVMVGVYYAIYFVNSYLLGMLNFVLLSDIWTIPFIALGISLVSKKSVSYNN